MLAAVAAAMLLASPRVVVATGLRASLHEKRVEVGWAWVLPSARKDAALVKLEAAAREGKRGRWAAEAAPLEPWLWRELVLITDVETKVLAPEPPCTCPPCGSASRHAARRDVVERMKASFGRASCGGVGCPACATTWTGTNAVCREGQCAAE
jgi:hypothetical protein